MGITKNGPKIEGVGWRGRPVEGGRIAISDKKPRHAHSNFSNTLIRDRLRLWVREYSFAVNHTLSVSAKPDCRFNARVSLERLTYGTSGFQPDSCANRGIKLYFAVSTRWFPAKALCTVSM
jgi:hypothetical protein